jgi:hypothetical protein
MIKSVRFGRDKGSNTLPHLMRNMARIWMVGAIAGYAGLLPTYSSLFS